MQTGHRRGFKSREREEGNILFTALLMLLVMNLMGIGLVQNAMKENRVANRKQVDSLTFQASESCVRDAVAWLKSQTRPSDALPHSIQRDNLSAFTSESDPASIRTRMQEYSYNCTITSLITKTVTGADEGFGEKVSMGDGYGASGDLAPRYYYQVEATGEGPEDTAKRIVALVSVTY